MRRAHVAAQDAATAVAGCGGDVSMLIRAPVTFNPLAATSGNDQQIIRLVFGALVKMDDQSQPVPDLAETVDVSTDARTYTFTLREGLVFNDGTPLTSRDPAFTLERAIDGRTGSYWQGRLLGIAGAEAYSKQEATTLAGVETPDERTLRITLEEPDATFLLTLGNFSGLGILPEHALKDVPPEELGQRTFLEPTVSAGPFDIVKYETDQFVELRRSETYGGTRAALDRILLPIRTPDVAMAELERGEIDVMLVPLDEAETASSIPGVSVVSARSVSFDLIHVNLTRAYLQDKRVRQAMMYAIDRQAIVDSVLQGQAEVVNSPIFGPDWIGVPDGLEPYAYDPEKAKQLLADAGWNPDQKLVMVVPPDLVDYPAIVHQQLREVGFDAELLQVEVNEFLRRLIDDADYDLCFNGGGTFRADPNNSAQFFLTTSVPPAGGNFSRYSNPRIDELYAQGRATVDLAEREQIYTEVAQILNDDVPWIFLWSANSLFAVNDRVHGFVGPQYSDNRLWNAEEWTVDC